MKHYHNPINGIKEFGIDALTGEACAYGLRLLCDLSAEACDLVRDFFGLGDKTAFDRNMNSSHEYEGTIHQHVSSMMLPRGIFAELLYFALIHKGKYEVYLWNVKTDEITCCSKKDYNEHHDYFEHDHRVWFSKKADPNVQQGSRNVHQFSRFFEEAISKFVTEEEE